LSFCCAGPFGVKDGLAVEALRRPLSVVSPVVLINKILKDLDILRKVTGKSRETQIREAFKDMLKAWGRSQDLIFVAEYDFVTPTKNNRQVDGALLT
jgi:hypothetical protein